MNIIGTIILIFLEVCAGGITFQPIPPYGSPYTGTAKTSPASLTSQTAPASSTSAPRHQFANYQNIPISYFEYGDSKHPTIVVTGGWPWDSSGFDGLGRQLASDGFHVIRYDQRGSGESGHPNDESSYSLPNLANEFRTVIDTLAPGKPITVFGEAWSPFIGSEYACTYPGRVKSIVSVGTPSFDLAQNALNRATVRVLNDSSSIGSVVKQLAALSYFFLLDIPIIPEWLFNSGIPAFLVNAVTTLIDNPSELFKEDPSYLANNPTHKNDYGPGSNKYKWIVNNRILNAPKWSYLPVENLRVFQMKSDVIEGPILVENLDQYTPNLNITELRGGHLDFAGYGNYQTLYNAVKEYALRAQE